MLIKGTALVWYDDQENELAEGGVVSADFHDHGQVGGPFAGR